MRHHALNPGTWKITPEFCDEAEPIGCYYARHRNSGQYFKMVIDGKGLLANFQSIRTDEEKAELVAEILLDRVHDI